VLELEASTVINLWAVAEFVPAKWKKVDVALYHVVTDDYDLVDARVIIKAAPQKSGEVLRDSNHADWIEVYNGPMPDFDEKPDD